MKKTLDNQNRGFYIEAQSGDKMKKLKCVITITGEEQSGEVQVLFDFSPPIHKEDKNHWDGSGAAALANDAMQAILKKSNNSSQGGL